MFRDHEAHIERAIIMAQKQLTYFDENYRRHDEKSQKGKKGFSKITGCENTNDKLS